MNMAIGVPSASDPPFARDEDAKSKFLLEIKKFMEQPESNVRNRTVCKTQNSHNQICIMPMSGFQGGYK